jgi:hypothetical protein
MIFASRLATIFGVKMFFCGGVSAIFGLYCGFFTNGHLGLYLATLSNFPIIFEANFATSAAMFL